MKFSINSFKLISEPVKASLFFTIATILQKGISTITIPIFTRLLSAEQYGLFSVYQSWSSILTVFCTLMLSAGAFNKGMVKFENDKESFISSLQGLTSTLTIVVFIFYFLFQETLDKVFDLPSTLIYLMFVSLFFSSSREFWAGELRFRYLYKPVIILSLSLSVFVPLISIFVVLISDNKGVARITSAALVGIIVNIVIYFYNFSRGKKFFDLKYWKYALNFNIPLIPHYLSGIILSHSDRIMINNYVGTDKAGIYSVAYSLAMLVTIINTSINNSFVPWEYKSIKQSEFKSIERASSIVTVIVGISSLGLIIFAPEIIMLFAPVEYYEAIWIIPPVSLSAYLMFLFTLFGNIEFYFEENKFIMIASIVGAILNIVLNYFLIPIYGYIIAGYTTLFCYLIFCITHYLFMKKVIKKHLGRNVKIYDMKFITIFTIGLFVATTTILVAYNFPVIRVIIVLSSIIYGIVRRKKIANLISILSYYSQKGGK